MTWPVPVVIPSHLRAGKVRTVTVVADTKLCVPDAQAAEYAEHYPTVEVVAHPDDVVGLAPKRQWIYDRFGDVFMLDDDITSVVDMGSSSANMPKIGSAEAWAVIQRLADMAEQMGVYLYGFTHLTMPRAFNPMKPMRITGRIAGHSFGMRAGSRLYFTSETVAVEDFWVSGLNAHYHRKCLIDQRYGFRQATTFVGEGGQGARRTLETERRDTAFLQKMFGSEVIRAKGSSKLRSKAAHAYERTMHLPF